MHPLLHRQLARKLRQYKWHFVFQMLAALFFLYFTLLAFSRIEANVLLGAIGISSIAASTFVIFAVPQTKVAAPLRILGAYFIAMMIGLFCHHFTPMLHAQYHLTHFSTEYALGGAVAVTLSMFLMGLFEVEHPPAAGFALGLVIAPWNNAVILIVSTAAILLALIRYVFNKTLINFL